MRFQTIIFLAAFSSAFAQQPVVYTRADSLKGTYGPARSWWDVVHYDLHVTFDLNDSTLSGFNVISYKTLHPYPEMQIDLMSPLQLDSVVQDGKKLIVRRDGNAHFVSVGDQAPGAIRSITAYYHGKPVQAKSPPWDGGVIWSRDEKGRPWISVACQGMAAQAWFPNKDHMKDEPDSAAMHYTVPSDLFVVSNGRLTGVRPEGDVATFSWKVRNPINNYNIIPYIGTYTMIKDTFSGRGGALDLEYWVLQEHHAVARQHFVQVKDMLRCFEHWFGKYPFYSDGYKLVEAPFLGMEHQSAIAYGNGYQMGYKGRDLSNTGWGLKWDFIVVHESGHEWFGNNISAADVADNWVHEGFTAYSENLFTEWLFGRKAGAEYVIGTRTSVQNDKPVIAPYNVNAGGSLDLYYKAANMLHTIRNIVDNDSLWLRTLRGLNETFWHRTVGTGEIEDYLIKSLGADLKPVFDQYLRTTRIPVLEYSLVRNKLTCRWTNCNSSFSMPVELVSGQTRIRITPSAKKTTRVKWELPEVNLDPDFYAVLKRVD